MASGRQSPSDRELARYDAVLHSIFDIIASRRVIQFCIGITSNPTQRRAAYERWAKKYGANLNGFILLDWNRTAEDVVKFEEYLFYKTKFSKKYGNWENVAYFRNVNRNYDSQSIYIAWWSPEIYRTGGPGRPEKVSSLS